MDTISHYMTENIRKINDPLMNDMDFLFALPKDIINWIISFIETTNLNALILTSKWVHNFLHENIPKVWKCLTFNKKGTEYILFKISSVKRYSELNSLAIRDITPAEINLEVLFKSNLKTLALQNVKFNDAELKIIAKILEVNKTITDLKLPSNLIGLEGAIAIGEALKINVNLLHLNISSNRLGSKGAKAIASALAFNTTLCRLELSCNNIGFEGGFAIGQLLKTNTSIKYLVFANNYMYCKGIENIAEALKVNTTLDHLEFFGNLIGDSGAKMIAEAMKVNTNLKFLNLDRNCIKGEGGLAIAEALKVNISLGYLSIRDNRIGNRAQEAIKDALKINPIPKRFVNMKLSLGGIISFINH